MIFLECVNMRTASQTEKYVANYSFKFLSHIITAKYLSPIFQQDLNSKINIYTFCFYAESVNGRSLDLWFERNFATKDTLRVVAHSRPHVTS